MALQLSDDIWVHIGLHLKPRHLSQLMRTCKRVNRLVDNEAYWTRIAAHLTLRDSWLADVDWPRGEKQPSPACDLLPAGNPSLYYMVGLDQGYYQSMQCFLQRIPDTLDACMRIGSENDREYARKGVGLTLQEITLDIAKQRWPRVHGKLKSFAKAATLEFWVTDKTNRLGDKWRRVQKFLCEIEDDPMPAVYKRRIFRKMWDLFDGSMIFSGSNSHILLADDLFIF
jgi:hypothetical protein